MSQAPAAKDNAQVVRTNLLTPTEAAIAEAGKALFSESAPTGRDYCRFMVPICSGEVPTYLALLKFVGLPGAVLSQPSAIYAISAVPAILFVIAALVFVIGVLPHRFERETLDTPQGADKAYRDAINAGRTASITGTALFIAANLVAIAFICYSLVY